jgi:hypothetical protein
VEQHLRRCHACADEVDSLRQTVALVASLAEVELPPDFHSRLHERLMALGPVVAAKHAALVPSHKRGVQRWRVPAAAAAAVAAVALGWTAMSGVADLPDGIAITRSVAGLVAEQDQSPQPVVAVGEHQPGKQQPTQATDDRPDPAAPSSGQPNASEKTSGQEGGGSTGTDGQVAEGRVQSSTPPGDTRTQGGAQTATVPTDQEVRPQQVEPRLAYAATIRVPYDGKVEEALLREYAHTEKRPGALVIIVPASTFKSELERIVKERFPGAQAEDQTVDLGPAVRDVTDRLAGLKQDREHILQTVPKEEQAVRLAAVDREIKQLESDLELYQQQLVTGQIVIQFQTAR